MTRPAEPEALSDAAIILRAIAELVRSTYWDAPLTDMEDERIKQVATDAKRALDRLRARERTLVETAKVADLSTGIPGYGCHCEVCIELRALRRST